MISDSFPTNRVYSSGVGAIGGGIFFVGGTDASVPERTSQVDVYVWSTSSWTSMPSMPTSRGQTQVVDVGASLYVIGGMTPDGVLSTVEEYKTDTSQWSSKPPMPTARRSLASAFCDSHIFAVGGSNPGGYSAAFEAYSPSTSLWESLPSMPTGRQSLTAGCVDDAWLFALGGTSGNPSYYWWGVNNEFELYSIGGSAWLTSLPSMPTARKGLGSAVIGNTHILAFGGNTNAYIQTLRASAIVEIYDISTSVWSPGKSMPINVLNAKVCAMSNQEWAVVEVSNNLDTWGDTSSKQYTTQASHSP